MPARIGGAPEDDPLGIDSVQRPRVGDRGPVVLLLEGDREQLSRLAGGEPEVAVVERQRVEAGGGVALGEGKQAGVNRPGEAMCQDDAGAAPLLVGEGLADALQMDAGAANPAAVELDGAHAGALDGSSERPAAPRPVAAPARARACPAGIVRCSSSRL